MVAECVLGILRERCSGTYAPEQRKIIPISFLDASVERTDGARLADTAFHEFDSERTEHSASRKVCHPGRPGVQVCAGGQGDDDDISLLEDNYRNIKEEKENAHVRESRRRRS